MTAVFVFFMIKRGVSGSLLPGTGLRPFSYGRIAVVRGCGHGAFGEFADVRKTWGEKMKPG